jgi:hypothetical protein
MPPLVEIPQETLDAANTLLNMSAIVEAPQENQANALLNTAALQTCKHDFCLLHVNDCCGCSDTRSEDAQYMRFVEGVGDAPIGKREDEYCSNCRGAFSAENRLLDRFHQFLAIEPNEDNRSGLVFTAYLLKDELNNHINQCMKIENSLEERIGNSMNLT